MAYLLVIIGCFLALNLIFTLLILLQFRNYLHQKTQNQGPPAGNGSRPEPSGGTKTQEEGQKSKVQAEVESDMELKDWDEDL